MARTTGRDGPDPIDVQVGVRIRALRRLTGMSQDTLATKLGLSFQQVQKYEQGTNRVSASMLVKTARALRCAPEELLPPLSEPEVQRASLLILENQTDVRGIEELVRAFVQIPSEEERAVVLRLAELLAKRAG